MSVTTGSFRYWAADPLRPWVANHIPFQQSAQANAEWVRSQQSLLNLVQDFSDFFDDSETHGLQLVEQLVSAMWRPAEAESILTLSQVVTVAGGHFESQAASVQPLNATFGSGTLAGMALYVPADGSVDLAIATTQPVVIGVAKSDASASSLGEYITEGQVTRLDWTLVAGTVTLSPGAYYYLSPDFAGQITSVAPSTPGQSVVVVGRALTYTTFDVEISQPILL